MYPVMFLCLVRFDFSVSVTGNSQDSSLVNLRTFTMAGVIRGEASYSRCFRENRTPVASRHPKCNRAIFSLLCSRFLSLTWLCERLRFRRSLGKNRSEISCYFETRKFGISTSYLRTWAIRMKLPADRWIRFARTSSFGLRQIGLLTLILKFDNWSDILLVDVIPVSRVMMEELAENYGFVGEFIWQSGVWNIVDRSIS